MPINIESHTVSGLQSTNQNELMSHLRESSQSPKIGTPHIDQSAKILADKQKNSEASLATRLNEQSPKIMTNGTDTASISPEAMRASESHMMGGIGPIRTSPKPPESPAPPTGGGGIRG